MRWARSFSSAVFLLSIFFAVPAFAALPPATQRDLEPPPTLGFAPQPELFGTRAVFHGNTTPFRQWTDMMARTHAEFAAAQTNCTRGRPECEMPEWSQLVAELKPLPLREKVERANEILNRLPYVPTERNWHRAMYWEAPLEFLAYGGQCQDYAIAKYMLLRQAGVPANLMRMVVLRATAIGEDHAVLVVYVDGEPLLLDNLRSSVVPANSVTSYRPYYSINETGWWQHIGGRAMMTARR